jgi:hypothetical protein
MHMCVVERSQVEQIKACWNFDTFSKRIPVRKPVALITIKDINKPSIFNSKASKFLSLMTIINDEFHKHSAFE